MGQRGGPFGNSLGGPPALPPPHLKISPSEMLNIYSHKYERTPDFADGLEIFFTEVSKSLIFNLK